MTTTSRRLSQRGQHNRNNHTSGKEKGITRPKDWGIAINGDPTKLKGGALSTFNRLWAKYKAKNGVKN